MRCFKKKAITLASAVSLLAVSGMVNAGALDFYYFHHLDKARSLSRDENGAMTGYYPQLIDHAHPELGTFLQRYYVDETYASGHDAPVFFYLCGEATCYASALGGEIKEMAKKYHAKLIALEHRYYGKSIPRPTFSTNDLKYLTTDYALKDLAGFQTHISQTKNWTGKWVSFGGSYPGSLSAYYRLKYPELVAGALASSAPVRAKENFEEYDAHVTKVAGPQCAEKMRSATREIESVMSDQQRMIELKRSFSVESLRDNTDFLFLVADIGSAAVQYGYKAKFCEMLENSKDPLTGYAEFAQYLYRAWDISDPVSLAIQGAESENAADYADGLGMRQWYYQSCTEYGYWQNANSDAAQSTRSPSVNEAYFHNVCKRLFGITTKADTDLINSRFYTPLLNQSASRIFFTNGSTDPWSRLSMTAENGNATNRNLNYYTIEGAAHCDDLHQPRESDSASLRLAREKLSTLMTDWLL